MFKCLFRNWWAGQMLFCHRQKCRLNMQTTLQAIWGCLLNCTKLGTQRKRMINYAITKTLLIVGPHNQQKWPNQFSPLLLALIAGYISLMICFQSIKGTWNRTNLQFAILLYIGGKEYDNRIVVGRYILINWRSVFCWRNILNPFIWCKKSLFAVIICGSLLWLASIIILCQFSSHAEDFLILFCRKDILSYTIIMKVLAILAVFCLIAVSLAQ